MQVIEKTIPWWRKALNFALGGIRSGFGLFPRPARLEPVPVPTFSGGSKEIPEEKRDLTKAFPKIEMVAKAVPAEAAAKPRAVAELESEPERAKGRAEATREISDITSSRAKTHVDSVGVIRGLNPPPPSESGSSADSETEVAREADAVREAEAPVEAEMAREDEVACEAEIEPKLETAPLPATESNVVTVAEPAEVPAADDASDLSAMEVVNTEVLYEAAPEPVEEAESEGEAEPVVEPKTEMSVHVEVVSEARPETVEGADSEEVVTDQVVYEALPEPAVEESELVVDPGTNDSPEVANLTTSEPLKESEPVAETELEEIAEAETVTEFEAEPAKVIEPTNEAMPEPATERERTPEPVVEQTPAAGAGAQLVLTAESDAKEKADAKADEKAAAKLVARQKKLDESSEQSPFSVFVGQVYDGPLDLLLDLIRKQDIDIYDIPIARITAQFLAYVNQLKAGDVDVAGEFIYTASMLIHIKSKMLLPRAPSGPEDVAEDPRRELVERLLEHERFKNAAQMLQQKQMLEAATWSNPGAREFKGDEGAEPEIAADTVDLVRVFRDILERARNRPVLNVEEDSVTVGQMIQFLARRLTMEDKPVALRRLLSHTRSERALIAMFLALLEMVRLQAILLRQDRQFSEIFIKKHSGFDAVMNEGLGNARDDWR